MSIYNIVVIDSDQKSIKLIQNYVARFFPNITIVGTAQNVENSIELVKELNPDAVILDTHVDSNNPFRILDELKSYDIEIVILSSYERFAAKAIKYEISDYVLKPIELEQITSALHKVIKKLRTKEYIQNLKIKANHKKAEDLDIIAIPTLSKVELEHTKDILFFEAQGRYTTIHLIDNKQIVSSKNLGEYEKKLKNKGFYRVHNSYLINLSKLKQMYKKRNNFILELKGHQKPIPISKRKVDSLKRFLKIKE
ncbi:LytTR family DNA-binding domain-containing protein [uncultured Winogradskyella sp.]|uniref:LytR/AlgR family response regulator transcription factor n=1 Tax=uncultured Winogradskyella sp. TaxID=395353 RepID=UPI00260C3B6C|nr:LytTR family DNA-binding domain-containing protein [uncultured Winogradskyella sp.]